METILMSRRDPAAKAKQLRRAGIVPCSVYGAQLKESLSTQIEQSVARQLKRSRRNGSKVDVQVDGVTYPTLIKDLEYNSLRDEIVHISFQVLQAGKKVNSIADIVLLNRDKVPGVLEQIQLQVPHAALPGDLIDVVTVDLEGLPIGTVITVGDIPAFQSDKIELLTDAGGIVARISEKKRAGYAPAESAAE